MVRTLAVHPEQPNVVYAGAEVGLGRSDDAGTHWTRVDSPFNDQQVWAIAVDPHDPDSITVGTGAPSRAVMYRTGDAGVTWDRLSPNFQRSAPGSASHES